MDEKIKKYLTSKKYHLLRCDGCFNVARPVYDKYSDNNNLNDGEIIVAFSLSELEKIIKEDKNETNITRNMRDSKTS